MKFRKREDLTKILERIIKENPDTVIPLIKEGDKIHLNSYYYYKIDISNINLNNFVDNNSNEVLYDKIHTLDYKRQDISHLFDTHNMKTGKSFLNFSVVINDNLGGPLEKAILAQLVHQKQGIFSIIVKHVGFSNAKRTLFGTKYIMRKGRYSYNIILEHESKGDKLYLVDTQSPLIMKKGLFNKSEKVVFKIPIIGFDEEKMRRYKRIDTGSLPPFLENKKVQPTDEFYTKYISPILKCPRIYFLY